jgi:hypothetical protein
MASNMSFAGTVVFLRGSGCAGKTSLCRELVKLDSSWKYVEEDGIYYQEAAVHWQSEFPAEFATIQEAVDPENILHAVLRNQLLFKTNTSDEQRLKVKSAISIMQQALNSRDKKQQNGSKTSWGEALRDQIAQTIMDHAQHHNVIVDTWFVKPEHIQRVADAYRVVHVIAYSAFPEIVKRTMKRNYAALMNGKDISNLRFFHQALKSFTGTYDISDSSEKSIASLDKESVLHALDLVELQLQDSPQATGSSKTFTRGEFSLQEFQDYRKEFLDKFASQTAYSVPKLPFDMVVMTDEQNPAVSAQQIINFVENHEKNN